MTFFVRRDAMSTFPVLQESEGEWTSDKTVEILGLRIPAYFVFITGFQTRPDDVFVVSYPKSGELCLLTFVCIFHKIDDPLRLIAVNLNKCLLLMGKCGI